MLKKRCKKNRTHTFRTCKKKKKIALFFSFLKIDLYDFYKYMSKETCLNELCLSGFLA